MRGHRLARSPLFLHSPHAPACPLLCPPCVLCCAGMCNRQREEAAFQVRGVPSTVPTIPKPFNLASTDAHSAARARRAAREKEERLAQQCTFRPQTMESEKRQLIQRLLREEEEAAAAATAAGQPHRRV